MKFLFETLLLGLFLALGWNFFLSLLSTMDYGAVRTDLVALAVLGLATLCAGYYCRKFEVIS